jgi:hypothetical protein
MAMKKLAKLAKLAKLGYPSVELHRFYIVKG